MIFSMIMIYRTMMTNVNQKNKRSKDDMYRSKELYLRKLLQIHKKPPIVSHLDQCKHLEVGNHHHHHHCPHHHLHHHHHHQHHHHCRHQVDTANDKGALSKVCTATAEGVHLAAVGPTSVPAHPLCWETMQFHRI